MLKNILFLTVLLSISVFSSPLQDDITLLKSTPKEKRYLIMNKIKLRLSKMNANQRALAMQNLLKAVHSNKDHQQNSKMMQKQHRNHQKKEMFRLKNNQEHSENKDGKQKQKQHKGKH